MSEIEDNSLSDDNPMASSATDHSIAGRARVRAQLAADIEAFLRQGGEIREVETAGRVDAPRKAEPGYNSELL